MRRSRVQVSQLAQLKISDLQEKGANNQSILALFLYKNQTFAVISVNVTRLLHENLKQKLGSIRDFCCFKIFIADMVIKCTRYESKIYTPAESGVGESI